MVVQLNIGQRYQSLKEKRELFRIFVTQSGISAKKRQVAKSYGLFDNIHRKMSEIVRL